MATVGTAQSGGPPQQNIPQYLLRARSPSSPQVLSRPTLSRRKSSSPVPSNYSNGNELGVSMSPPKQQVILRSSRQQYSTGSLGVKPRPIHSMYSASQPQLNLEELDVNLRSRSHTVSNHDQRNRWSVVGLGENPDNGFNSGSMGRSYDLSLTKRSVEDLRPLPVPVVAPKVPPRRGSRLTTVPNQKHSEQIDKRYRETRSCEDILESVSTEEAVKPAKITTPQINRHHEGYLNKNDVSYVLPQESQQSFPIQSRSQLQTSPQPIPNVTYHAAIEPQLPSSQGENRTHISKDCSQSTEVTQTNRAPVAVSIPQRSHAGCASYANETEKGQVISDYSRNPYSSSSQYTTQRADQSNANFVTQSVTMHYPSQQAQIRDPDAPEAGEEYYYRRSSSVPISHSSHAAEFINQKSVQDSAYSSDTGLSSMASQHSSPAPPIDEVNDANLSMTPHTSCSSPSPSPQAYREGTDTTVINIPQNYQPFQDNKLVTAPHIPHYAIPTNSSSSYMQKQVPQPSNDSVQSLSVVHSYRHELDHASNTQTSCPPNNNVVNQSSHSQPQHTLSVHTSEVALAQQSNSTCYSFPQPADTNPLQSCAVAMEAQSHSVSTKVQAFAQAFSQWQYHGTTKKKGGSTKPNSRSEVKPPVKPKPASLMKGGSLSLKRDKNKSQMSAEANTKKKGGQKYIFKQSQSRTLLSRGRTPSQVDPLTDVGMEMQYNVYTPQKHSQSHSGSSSDSTLRDELKFTDGQKGFTASGPSPNSYDYGSQMTLTPGDATLTPSPSEMYGTHSSSNVYAQGLVQPPLQSTNGEHPRTLQQPQLSKHSTSSLAHCPSAYVQTQSHVHKGSQSTVLSANNVTVTSVSSSALQPATQAHVKPPSPHPCVSNSFSRLPALSNGQSLCSSSSIPPSELMPTSQLAPIAEVNLESEQSMSSLLNIINQTDSSHNSEADVNVRIDDTSTNLTNISQAANGNSSIGSDEVDGKASPTVQRASTLPSSYKRPKPYRFNPHKYQSVDIQEQGDESTGDEGAFASSSMKLSDFTALNTSIFPKHIKVSNTPVCSSGEVQISQGDVLDLHFVRQTKVVILMSNEEEYIVPLNSANRFALTYDPLNTGQLIHQGYHFKSVGELIATKEIPSVVMATEAYSDPKPQSSVEAGEILVICGVVKQAHGRVLKVNSTTYGKKFLEERCTVNFSTRPEDTKLSLNDMFKASVRLPHQAIIYPPAGLQLPDSLVNVPVILKQFRVIKSVIATPPSPQNYSPPSSVVYDINLEVGIEIQEHCEVTDHQMIEMRAKTQQLYSSFEPAKVIPFQSHGTRNKEQVIIQSALLTYTDQKGKFLGIQLELPEWLGQMRISKAKLHSQRESLSLQPSQDDTGSHGSTFLPLHSSISFQSTDLVEQRMTNMEKHFKIMDKKLNTLVQSFTSVVQQLTKLKIQSNLQQQTDSEHHHGHNQYVEMMLSTESKEAQESSGTHQDFLSLSGAANNSDTVADNQQARRRLDEEFSGVKEWQKKQEKHLQWQQEQVQHWQIECEKQMQEMQQKLTLLEDRQIKFFLEMQQKVKQWKDEQDRIPEHAEAQHKTPEEIKLGNVAQEKKEDSEKPQLPPKPSSELVVSPAKKSPTNRSPEWDGNAAPEAVDFGLDMIADNIASWCSQMELELNELYTNSVESNQ